MSKWWRIGTDRRWRGQSQTVGVVLLAAITLVLVAAIGLFVFSDTGGGEEAELLLTDLESELNAGNITISHAAGDTLNPEEVNVIVEGNTRTIPMDEFSGVGDEFSAGQTARYQLNNPSEFWIGEFRVIVVHEPSDTILHEEKKAVEFSDEGLQLQVADAGGGLSGGSASVWGKPTGAATLADQDEVNWDFKVTAAFGSEEQVITDSLGDAYDLSVPSSEFDDTSVSNGDDRGTLEAAEVSGDNTVTLKAEYTSDNVPDSIPDRFVTSTVDVTVQQPEQRFDVDGEINDTVTNNEVRVNYTIESTADLTLEQDITYKATAYEDNPASSSSALETKTDTELDNIGAANDTVTLAPGDSVSGSFNYTPSDSTIAANTEAVTAEVRPEIGDVFSATETFTSPTFEVGIAGDNVDPDARTLTVDYEIENTGSFSGRKDIGFNATAYDSAGDPITDPPEYTGTEYTDGYTGVQVNSSETLTTADSQIEEFSFDVPASTDKIRYNISTEDDTKSRTLDTVPAAFDVLSVTPQSQTVREGNTLSVDATLENTGGLSGTKTVDLAVTNGTALANSPVSKDVTLDGGQQKTKTFTIGTTNGDAGTGYEATVSTQSGNSTTTPESVTVQEPATFQVSIDSIDSPVVEGKALEIDVNVENTGDLDGTQTVELTVDNGPAGELGAPSRDVTLQSGDSTTETFSIGTAKDDAGDYDVAVSSENDTKTEKATVQEPDNFEIKSVSPNSPAEGETLEIDVNVENTGDIDGTQTVELTVDNGPAGELGAPSRDVTLQSGDSTTETFSIGTAKDDAGEYSLTVLSENDTATGTATVLQPPNFEIKSVSTNSPVTEGETLSVTTTITNPGEVEGTQTVDLTVGPSGQLGDASAGVTLSPSESKTVTLSVSTEPGDAGTYSATIKGGDTEPQAPVVVKEEEQEPPNFEIKSVSTNSPVTEGETLTVTATVENTGDVQGTQTVDLTVGPSGQLGGKSAEVTLSPEKSKKVTLSVSTEPGDAGTYTAVVSSDNDTASEVAKVNAPAAPANFQVTSVSTNSPVTEGNTLTVTATVENTGGQQGTQTIELSVGALGSDSTQVTLKGGESTQKTLSVGTSSGDAGCYTATVFSKDDSADADVRVDLVFYCRA